MMRIQHYIAIALVVWLVGMEEAYRAYENRRPKLRATTAVALWSQFAIETGQDSPDQSLMHELLIDGPPPGNKDLPFRPADLLGDRNPPYALITRVVGDMGVRMLNGLKHDPPTRKDFESVGFEFPDIRFRGRGEWPSPVAFGDVDGDGRSEVLMSYPGGWPPGVVLLFHRTVHGWECLTLESGCRTLGVWLLPLTESGPNAVVIESLAGSEYEPNALFDVFTWRNSRLENVLSTTIIGGWQWDHKFDASGNQILNLHYNANESARRSYNPAASSIEHLRWNGAGFETLPATAGPAASEGSILLRYAQRELLNGRFSNAKSAAVRAADMAVQGKEFGYGERRFALIYRGLIDARKGNAGECLKWMTRAVELKDDYESGLTLARDFIATYDQRRSLSDALLNSGWLMPLLESVIASNTTSKPRSAAVILKSAGIDSPATIVDCGGGNSVVGLTWPGGSAVVAFWKVQDHRVLRPYLLAYSNKRVKGEYRDNPVIEMVVMHPPALQLDPPAQQVEIRRLSASEESAGLLGIRYLQGGTWQNGVARWNGATFVAEAPKPQAMPDLFAAMGRIESSLFAQQKYADSLDVLRQFEDYVREADVSTDTKEDVILECYYFESVCYRRLGNARKAETILDGLLRANPNKRWPNVAYKWLRIARPSP